MFEIASDVDTPLIIDSGDHNRLCGLYVHIQVDMDIFCHRFYKLLMEKEGFAFNVEVQYEWLSDFCTHCKHIGHNFSKFRWLHTQQNGMDDKGKLVKLDKGKHPEKIHLQSLA